MALQAEPQHTVLEGWKNLKFTGFAIVSITGIKNNYEEDTCDQIWVAWICVICCVGLAVLHGKNLTLNIMLIFATKFFGACHAYRHHWLLLL